MGNCNFSGPSPFQRQSLAVASVLAAVALGACSTTPSTTVDSGAPVAAPAPEMPSRVRAAEIVGRYGYAPITMPRTATAPRPMPAVSGKQPFVIARARPAAW